MGGNLSPRRHCPQRTRPCGGLARSAPEIANLERCIYGEGEKASARLWDSPRATGLHGTQNAVRLSLYRTIDRGVWRLAVTRRRRSGGLLSRSLETTFRPRITPAIAAGTSISCNTPANNKGPAPRRGAEVIN